MKNGKHAAAGGMKRSLVLVVSVLALVLAVAGGTLAWLSANTTPVTNTFTPAQVSCTVEENFDGTTKKDVQIKNTSNIDAYIRAYVVVTWKDAQGNVYGKLPVKNTDYTMTGPEAGWVEKDGYYYYTSPVAANGGLTGVLISECKLNEGVMPPADGYSLSVEIIAEAIQSQPTTTVTSVWPVTVDTDGALTPKSGN